jgi:ribosomal protein S26
VHIFQKEGRGKREEGRGKKEEGRRRSVSVSLTGKIFPQSEELRNRVSCENMSFLTWL